MILANFLIELRGLGAAGQTSRHKDIIKVNVNITFHMVLRVASHSQFLAGLTAKLSILWGAKEVIVGLENNYIQKTHLTTIV